MRTKKKIQAALEVTQLPSIRLTAAQKSVTCVDSKFGGVFYLPQGEHVPTCPEGEPMQFLAQVNFSQMPPLKGFPQSGLLQFFLDTDETRFEEKIDDPDSLRELYAVRYYPSPNAALQQKEADIPKGTCVQQIPGHLDLPWLDGKMAFRSTTEVATVYGGMDGLVCDLGYQSICEQQITSDLIQQSGYDLENSESATDDFCWDFGNWRTKIGGHPAVHQVDCRADWEEYMAYTVLLFQYDFSTKEEMEADTFQFFIKPEDLAVLHFDDVLLCWHNCF